MVQAVRSGLFNSRSWIIAKQLLYASKRQKSALESYLLGYKMARWTIGNWQLALVRLSMKHNVGFRAEDLKSFIVSCLITLNHFPCQLICIPSRGTKNTTGPVTMFLCTMHCTASIPLQQTHPMNKNKQTSRQKKQPGSRTILSNDHDLYCLFFMKKKRPLTLTEHDRLGGIYPSLSHDDANEYAVPHTPMAGVPSRYVIHYPVSTGL